MIRKLLFVLFFIGITVGNSYALDLSRVKVWVDEILTAADLNAEFNNILNHEIANNDVAAAAGIVGSKLDLTAAGAIGGTTPAAGAFTTLSATGATILKDKVSFTQTDNNEYIDSLADGYLDSEATTGLRFRINTTEQINLVDGVLQPTTDDDIDLGSSSKEFKNLFIDGTADIDTLIVSTAGTITGLIDLSANYISLLETSDPTTAASEGAVYTKDIGGQPELVFREESNGDVVQITSSGQLVGNTIYITASDASWDVPEGISKVYIYMIGGGGGGGNGGGYPSDDGGGGGSSGSWIVNHPVTVTPGGTVAITIGEGGASDNAGNNSSFGSVTALGGNEGEASADGSAGGVSPGGFDSSSASGGGLSQKGGNGYTNTTTTGGGGGGSPFGVGGDGGTSSNLGDAAAANTGSGGGGGGGNQLGGAGGSGVCIIQY